jgi:hypothetical protein
MFILGRSVTGMDDMKSEIDSPKEEILKALFLWPVSPMGTVNIEVLAGDIGAGTGPFQSLSGHVNQISAKVSALHECCFRARARRHLPHYVAHPAPGDMRAFHEGSSLAAVPYSFVSDVSPASFRHFVSVVTGTAAEVADEPSACLSQRCGEFGCAGFLGLGPVVNGWMSEDFHNLREMLCSFGGHHALARIRLSESFNCLRQDHNTLNQPLPSLRSESDILSELLATFQNEDP